MKSLFTSKKKAMAGSSMPSGPPVNASQDQLRKWFTAIDRDGNGTLDSAEVQRALALGNLHFSLQATAHMIRLHDSKGAGVIHFPEFEKLHHWLTNMQNSFVQYDADNSGSLDNYEVQQALAVAGAGRSFGLDQPAFQALFKAFDPDQSNSLSLPEFIGLTLFLQSATATFNAFDSNRSGTITLDFNQWIYAVSNVV